MYQFIVEGLFMVTVGCVGLCFNLMSFVGYLRKDCHRTFHRNYSHRLSTLLRPTASGCCFCWRLSTAFTWCHLSSPSPSPPSPPASTPTSTPSLSPSLSPWPRWWSLITFTAYLSSCWQCNVDKFGDVRLPHHIHLCGEVHLRHLPPQGPQTQDISLPLLLPLLRAPGHPPSRPRQSPDLLPGQDKVSPSCPRGTNSWGPFLWFKNWNSSKP